MARRGLGKGLDALIPGDIVSGGDNDGPQNISIKMITPNPSQPRTKLNDNHLEELAESIREHGILQPLIVTRNQDKDAYELIAGERRLRAAKLAGLESVPVIIRNASHQERLEIALIENLQREDLSPVEAAAAYQKLKDDFNLSQDDISRRVGKSRTAIANTIRLLKLPKQILEAISSAKITEGHGRALLGLPNKKAMQTAYQSIIKNELTVRQTEELVRKLSGVKPKSKTKSKPKSPEIKIFESKLRESLGTKVTISQGKNSGTIVIHFYSEEELNALLDLLSKD